MSSNQENCIIIRQEVILPTGWGPGGTPIILASPSPAPATSPTPVTSPKAPEKRHYVLDTTISSITVNGCQVTITGYGQSGGADPLLIKAGLYLSPTTPPPTPDGSCSGVTPASGSGSFTIVLTAPGPGTYNIGIYAGYPTGTAGVYDWQPAYSTVVVPESGCSGSGSGSGMFFGFAPSSTHEVAPPRCFLVEFPCSARLTLQFDDFCSSPDQPIWVHSSNEASWALKVCRYGDRLLGVLVDRKAGPFAWITDQFCLAGENRLYREGNPSSCVVIRPA